MRERRQWSRKKICKTIRSLHNAGCKLNPKTIQEIDKPLMEAGRKYFGSWKEAVEAAGIDYTDVIDRHPRGYWNEERITGHIRKLHQKGEDLNSHHIQVSHKALYGAACKYCGSWGEAIEAAGFDYSEVRSVPKFRSWSKDLIIGTIQQRVKERKSLNTMDVIEDDYALYRAVKRYYNEDAWKSALRDAGIDPNSLPDPRKKWTKNVIIDRIRELHSQGESLQYSHILNRGYRGLTGSARKIFGSWGKAIEAAGFDYEDVRATSWSKWTVKRVFSEIKALDDAGEDLNAGYVARNHKNLWQAAYVRFPSWAEAVEAAGINYEEHRLRGPYLEWSVRRVISMILELHRELEDLSSSAVHQWDRRLYDAACQYFGCWQNAVEAAGFDYSTYRKVRQWDRAKVIEEIKMIDANDEPLNAAHVIRNHSGLYGAAMTYWGSWSNAVSEAGIDYISVRETWSTEEWVKTLSYEDIKALEQEIELKGRR